jgi:cytochrome c oxidase subunit 4
MSNAHEHATPWTVYFWTWVALVVLAAATYLLSKAPIGGSTVHATVALFIAVVKALLVAMIFMHLLEQRSVNRLFFLIATLFIVLLVGLTVADVVTRDANLPLPQPPPPGQRA